MMLHQNLKFITSDNMIVIGEEEDIMVSHISSFQYIDIDGETVETRFQDLEVVSMVTVQPTKEQPKSEPSMAYWKGAKSLVETRDVQCRGKLVEIHEKKNQFGLGYQASFGKRDIQDDKWIIPLVEKIFTSVGHIFSSLYSLSFIFFSNLRVA